MTHSWTWVWIDVVCFLVLPQAITYAKNAMSWQLWKRELRRTSAGAAPASEIDLLQRQGRRALAVAALAAAGGGRSLGASGGTGGRPAEHNSLDSSSFFHRMRALVVGFDDVELEQRFEAWHRRRMRPVDTLKCLIGIGLTGLVIAANRNSAVRSTLSDHVSDAWRWLQVCYSVGRCRLTSG
jgi:hypothetical protein